MINKVILILTGLFVLILCSNSIAQNSDATKKKATVQTEKVVFSCPMHQEVFSDKAGKCPKCGMTLEKQVEFADKACYSCPMHSEIKSDKMGKCSKC
jgi:hypothetical protein